MLDKNHRSKDKIDRNFFEVINILNENKISYWVCHGTLLGIIRDKKLISWDPDIDIAVLQNSSLRSKISKLLKNRGFKEIKKTFLKYDGMQKFIKKNGREVDINYYQESKAKNQVYIKWPIPKNLIMRIVEVLSISKSYSGNFKNIIRYFQIFESFFIILKKFLVKKNWYYSMAGYSHKKQYIDKLKNYKFYNLNILVPHNYTNYLKSIYGDDWRVPKKKFNWIRNSPSTIFHNN